MNAEIRDKIRQFQVDARVREKFLKAVLAADLEDVIRPEKNPGHFGKAFQVRWHGVNLPFPLIFDQDRIHFISLKLDALIMGEGKIIHPLLAYYYLHEYQQKFHSPASVRLKKISKKKTESKSKKKSRSRSYEKISPARRETLKQNRILYNRLKKIKGRLAVSARAKKARTGEELRDIILSEIKGITEKFLVMQSQVRVMEGELGLFRNPDYLHPDLKKKMESLEVSAQERESALTREKERTEALEGELSRLAEQIITGPSSSSVPMNEEMETLRREYNMLSQKYDSIVSKNIELSNRLDRVNKAKDLEDLLNIIRDKINAVLRAGVRQSDDVLLKNVQNEISQLQRTRGYLGRALYDVGMLYLRMNDREKAVPELRAARELGVEDPEINRILNSHP